MGTLRLHANTLTLRAAILPLLTRTLRIESLILADAQLDLPRDDTRFKLPKWPEVLPRLDPVSYTHLDVYKRQTQQ